MKSGFTLIEAVIVVALIGVMMVVLAVFYFSGYQTYQSQDAELNLNFYARSALDDIDNYVRQSTQTLSSYSTYSAGPDVLILEIPSVNVSDQIVPATYDHAVIHLSGDKLYREVIPDAASARPAETKLLAENISSFSFSYDNVDYAQVTQVSSSISLSRTAGKETRSMTLSSKSFLRN